MSAIAKSLAKGLTVHTTVHIRSVCWDNGVWQLSSESGTEYITRSIIMTPPVPQILKLLHDSDLTLPSPVDLSLRKIEYEPCLALMVIADPTASRLEEAFIDLARGIVELLIDNHAKGVTAQPGAISLHASAEFSRAMFQESDEEIARQMLDDVRNYIDVSHVTWQLHRWRYSRAVVRSPEPFLHVEDPGLMFFAGDGFGTGEIEGAVLSGRQTAEELLRHDL
jgi:predicted NAD/FAD-dependent oxidoreductase